MRVAAVQVNTTGDIAANIERGHEGVRAAAADGARLILLPEKWAVLGRLDDLRAGAEPLDGPIVSGLRALAQDLSIDLVAGSYSERIEGAEKLGNTSLHIGPDGELKAIYRKMHMFDVVVDGKEYRESDAEEPGEEIVTSQTADGVGLGLTICYDLRFPELYRSLALRGARILLVPAAFTVPTTRDHWEILLRARAIEEQAFVLAANQIGPHLGEMRSGGRSMIIDPWGVVLAGAPDRVGHIIADLDLDAQERTRRDLPSLANAHMARRVLGGS
ncbi:MAG: carbon-nitrogen hydrolase family protein [Solirubrobacterales bacterium]